jgi:hypothetical protein
VAGQYSTVFVGHVAVDGSKKFEGRKSDDGDFIGFEYLNNLKNLRLTKLRDSHPCFSLNMFLVVSNIWISKKNRVHSDALLKRYGRLKHPAHLLSKFPSCRGIFGLQGPVQMRTKTHFMLEFSCTTARLISNKKKTRFVNRRSIKNLESKISTNTRKEILDLAVNRAALRFYNFLRLHVAGQIL